MEKRRKSLGLEELGFLERQGLAWNFHLEFLSEVLGFSIHLP